MRIECKGDRVSMSKNEYGQVMNELNQYKTERDTCLEDIEKLRERNKELEQENEKLRNNYNSLTQHIRQKAEANPGVSRYIDLVNYIDRLERADDEH